MKWQLFMLNIKALMTAEGIRNWVNEHGNMNIKY